MRRDERLAAVLTALLFADLGITFGVIALSRGAPQELAEVVDPASPWLWVVAVVNVVAAVYLIRLYIRESYEVGPPPSYIPTLGVEDDE